MPWGWAKRGPAEPVHGGSRGTPEEAKISHAWPQYEAAFLKDRLQTGGGKYGAGAQQGVAEHVYFDKISDDYKAEADENLRKEFTDWLQGTHLDNTERAPYLKSDDPLWDGRARRRAVYREEGEVPGGEMRKEWKPTYWGNKQLTHLPGVREHLRDGHQAQEDAELQMNLLAEHGPQNIEEAWMYFKHWVKGRPVSLAKPLYVQTHTDYEDAFKWDRSKPKPEREPEESGLLGFYQWGGDSDIESVELDRSQLENQPKSWVGRRSDFRHQPPGEFEDAEVASGLDGDDGDSTWGGGGDDTSDGGDDASVRSAFTARGDDDDEWEIPLVAFNGGMSPRNLMSNIGTFFNTLTSSNQPRLTYEVRSDPAMVSSALESISLDMLNEIVESILSTQSSTHISTIDADGDYTLDETTEEGVVEEAMRDYESESEIAIKSSLYSVNHVAVQSAFDLGGDGLSQDARVSRVIDIAKTLAALGGELVQVSAKGSVSVARDMAPILGSAGRTAANLTQVGLGFSLTKAIDLTQYGSAGLAGLPGLINDTLLIGSQAWQQALKHGMPTMQTKGRQMAIFAFRNATQSAQNVSEALSQAVKHMLEEREITPKEAAAVLKHANIVTQDKAFRMELRSGTKQDYKGIQKGIYAQSQSNVWRGGGSSTLPGGGSSSC